jgi:Tfp pilus assembly protein PilF
MTNNGYFHWIAIPALVLVMVLPGCSQASNAEDGSNQERAENLIRMAGKSFAGGNFRKNADLLKEAAATDPQNIRVWWKLCEAYQLTGELDLAVKACEQQLSLHPSSSSHNGLGLVYLAKKDSAKAASEFEKAAANTDDQSYYSNYVWSLLESKQYERAIPVAQRLVELNKNDPHELKTAYHWLGIAYMKTGQKDKAQESVRLAYGKNCSMDKDDNVQCVGSPAKEQ